MRSDHEYPLDVYVFLTRPPNFLSLHHLRGAGDIRAVARTVSGPHESILAIETESIETLPELYGRIGVNLNLGDLTAVGVPHQPNDGGMHIHPLPFTAFLILTVEQRFEVSWVEDFGGSSASIGLSSIYGYGNATHLVEVANESSRGLADDIRAVRSHEGVALVASYITGSSLMAGAGPRA